MTSYAPLEKIGLGVSYATLFIRPSSRRWVPLCMAGLTLAALEELAQALSYSLPSLMAVAPALPIS